MWSEKSPSTTSKSPGAVSLPGRYPEMDRLHCCSVHKQQSEPSSQWLAVTWRRPFHSLGRTVRHSARDSSVSQHPSGASHPGQLLKRANNPPLQEFGSPPNATLRVESKWSFSKSSDRKTTLLQAQSLVYFLCHPFIYSSHSLSPVIIWGCQLTSLVHISWAHLSNSLATHLHC